MAEMTPNDDARTKPFLGPTEPPDDLMQLGPYRILELLGQGGMGKVYVAEDEMLKRRVALKVMKADSAADSQARERFLREARAAANIQHDNIIPIFQVGVDKDIPYLAMPLLKGMTLDHWLRKRKKLSIGQILRLGRDIAKGLAAAHDHGLIHRDIKPANIWLEAPNGRVKILDFGLVRTAKKEDVNLTKTGLIVGTPAYMAPEQARSQAVDGRADLFSLGVVLYRLCTGKLPFQGDTPIAILTALAADTPARVREQDPEIPDALDDLIMQLLEKDKERRPASAKAVVEAIQAIERQQASAAPTAIGAGAPAAPAEDLNAWKDLAVADPIDPPTPAAIRKPTLHVKKRRKRARPSRLLVGAVAAGCGGLAVVIVLLIAKAFQPATVVQGPPSAGATPGEPARTTPVPRIEPAKFGDQATALRKTLQKHELAVNGVAFSPDGKWLASCSGMYPEDGKGGEVLIWDRATDTVAATLPHSRARVVAVAFSPKRDLLAISSEDGIVRLWDVAVRQEKQRWQAHAHGAHCVVFSPDGQRLATSGRDGLAKIWTADGQNPLVLSSGGQQAVFTVAFSSDGKTVATGGIAQPVILWDAGSGQRRGELPDGFRTVHSVAFSPDAQTLATTSWDDRMVRLWNVGPLLSGKAKTITEPRATLTGHRFEVNAVAFHPDGRRIVTGSGNWQTPKDGGEVKVWDAATGKHLADLPGHTERVASLAIAADGTLASASWDKTVKLWALPGGAPREAAKPANSPPQLPAPADAAAFAQRVAKLKPREQLEAVREELKRLNPGYDGQMNSNAFMRNEDVQRLDLPASQLTNIAPVAALATLTELQCTGTPFAPSKLKDLSPLRNLQLKVLDIGVTDVEDLSPLANMPLEALFIPATKVRDLSPLKAMRLKAIGLGNRMLSASDKDILRSIPTLEKINGQPKGLILK